MITHLFIHASVFVKNKQDLPSLILEDLHGQPVLFRLLETVQCSQTVSLINVVTSDKSIDDGIVKCIENFKKDRLNIPINVIRISSEQSYKIDDSNRIINTDFISTKPYYGFYSPDCLLDYVSQNHIDLALVLTADDTPLLEATLIDKIVNGFDGKSFFYGHPHMGGSKIFLIQTRELSGKLSASKYKNKNSLQNCLDNIGDDIECMRVLNENIDTESVERDKKRSIEKYFSKKIDLEYLLRELNDNCAKQISLQESYQFYQLHHQRDLEVIKDVYGKFLDLSVENHEEFIRSIEKKSNHKYPSVLEIELTNRCNLKCDYCPHTVLKRPEEDLKEEFFKKLVDEFVALTPIFVLSGYGEPTLHPKIIEFIKYAKNKGVARVCLETNGTQLDDKFLNKLIDAKLDILLLNLDAYDNFNDGKTERFPSEKLVCDIIGLRSKKRFAIPYLVLQTVNKKTEQKTVNYYYKRWEYIADAVSIQSFNDYCHTFAKNELIDMIPSTEPNVCSKTTQNLFLLSNGKTTLCKQKFDGFQPSDKKFLPDMWADNYLNGGRFDFCRDCSQKFFIDFRIPDKIDQFLKIKLNKKLYESLIKEKIDSAGRYFDNKDYLKALEECEYILKYCPDNEFVNKKLDEILKKSD